MGQPDSINQNIVNMAHAFIKKPNCIILVVSPANGDLANSDAIRTSQKVDPEGQRTFGVLTKADIMENFTEVLEERSLQFKFRWSCVCNRSQQDIESNVDMSATLLREHEFFANRPEHKHSPLMGSEKLMRSISKVLKSLLMSSITKLESELNPAGTRFIGAGLSSVLWAGLPTSSLAPVRSQRGTKTCAFQAAMVTTETRHIVNCAAQNPPQKFLYKLSLSDFQEMHKQQYPDVWKKRGDPGGQLWQAIRVLEKTGVYDIHVDSGEQSADRFKIQSFVRYECEDIRKIIELLNAMKAVAARFPCSENYECLEPREVYQYDPNSKARNGRGKERGHCVMIVGYFEDDLEKIRAELNSTSDHEEKIRIFLKARLVLVYQNSYGKEWGVCGGFGFIE